MAKRDTAITPWPHGQPTRPCPDCKGTGLNRRLADQHITSHAVAEVITTDLRCRYCMGRGRILTDSPKGTV